MAQASMQQQSALQMALTEDSRTDHDDRLPTAALEGAQALSFGSS